MSAYAGLARSNQILEWRCDGVTFKEIGRRLGLTRQRVAEIYREATDPNPTSRFCWCGTELERGNRKYCSMEHRPQVPRAPDRSGSSCRICGTEFGELRQTDVCLDCRRGYVARRAYYVELAERQGHACAICGCAEVAATKMGGTRKLAVDHCHRTGVIRELLCMRCNTLIGSAKDDPDRLDRAAAYLRKHAA